MAPPTAGPTTGGRGMASTEHSNARQRIMVLTMFPDLLMLLWGCLRLKKFFFFGFLASTMGGGRKQQMGWSDADLFGCVGAIRARVPY